MISITAEATGSREPYITDPDVNSVVDLLIDDSDKIIDDVIYILIISKLHKFESTYKDIEDFYDSDSIELTLLSSIKENLYNIYEKDDGYRGNLRGAILELFIFKLMQKKYECHRDTIDCDHFEIDCKLTINGRSSEKTVDIYASNLSIPKAECYECKINISNLDADDIDHLNEVHHFSDGLISPRVISFSDVVTIKIKFRELGKSPGNIICYGKQSFTKRDFLTS